MLLEIGVMWHTSGNTKDKHIIDFLKSAQQTSGRVSGRCHRFTATANRWQFCADDAMSTNIAQRVHIRFA